MRSELPTAVRMVLVLTVLTGLIYPAGVTVLARVLFPFQAHGSLLRRGDTLVGSALIGQSFTRPEYFHPRPSAAGARGYDARASSGANLGPTNRALMDHVARRVDRYRAENHFTGLVPADAVTASASGLDPHISPANAAIQAGRVAAARGASVDDVRRVVAQWTERPWLGFVGEPRVNVLLLNLALDRRWPLARRGP